MDTNIKPNSHKYKEQQKAEEKNIQKVITGVAKTKKKSNVHKFTDIFVSEDINNVKTYILIDVLVPAMKKALSDIVTNGIEMLLYGESGRSKRSSGTKVSYRSYDKAYDDRRGRDYSSPRTRTGYSYDEVILDNRAEAQDVLDELEAIIEKYDIASVADLYEMVGITGVHTDHKYGWTDIRNASVVRVRDGYMLKLPRPLPFD